MKGQESSCEVDRLKAYIQGINKKDRPNLINFDITPFVVPLMMEEQQPKLDNK